MIKEQWKLLILFHLFSGHVRRFSALDRGIPRKAEANAAKHGISFEDIAIRVDAGVLDQFRKEARRRRVGYQTLINDALARHVRKDVA